MLSSIVTMDATLSMAQESVPSVVLVILGCMIAMLECISMLVYYACDVTSWIRSVSVCMYLLGRHVSE